MESMILWLWPLVVLGSVAVVALIVTNRDRNPHGRHGTPAE